MIYVTDILKKMSFAYQRKEMYEKACNHLYSYFLFCYTAFRKVVVSESRKRKVVGSYLFNLLILAWYDFQAWLMVGTICLDY
jgi:hypothetical protein